MIIKKHPNGNEYLYSGDTWIRNFTKKQVSAIQISNLFDQRDYKEILKNEELNRDKAKISDEKITFEKVLIVSDGFNFSEKHKVISKFPKDVCIIVVNKALRKWSLLSSKIPPEDRRTVNAYLINNPYKEALNFMPSRENKYFPTCIASIRTNNEFIKNYKGDVYVYKPSFEKDFGFVATENYYIDDYRNPICGAVSMAFQFGVRKLMLFCCDDSFEDQRENSVKLENGLYTYKPHLRSHEIIDGNLHWLLNDKNAKIEIADYSSGPKYRNAAYINSEEAACAFFLDQMEGISNE